MFGQGCGQFQMCLLLQRLSFQVLFYSLIIMLLYITVIMMKSVERPIYKWNLEISKLGTYSLGENAARERNQTAAIH